VLTKSRGACATGKRAGVTVLRDPYTAKPYVLFYTTKCVGGGVQDFDAIMLMKFATSCSAAQRCCFFPSPLAGEGGPKRR
jgi:hypothetical protein